MTAAERLLDLYRGRSDVFAAHDRESGHYAPVWRPLTTDDLEAHVRGESAVGVYVIRENDTVCFGSVDIDDEQDPASTRPLADQVRAQLVMMGIPTDATLISYSGNKGHHVDLFVSHPIPPSVMRRVLAVAAHRAGVAAEIFPKQDTRHNDGKSLGNLVKLPLAHHPKTGNVAEVLDHHRVEPVDAALLRSIVAGVRDEDVAAAIKTIELPDASADDRVYHSGQREPRITQLVRSLNRNGILPDAIEEYALRENRERFQPPHTEGYVRAKVRDVLSRYRKDRGTVEPPIESPDHRDQTAALRQLAGQPDEPAPSAPRQFTPLTARQFIELPDPEGSDNLLGPLLRRKQRTIIGGHTGEGKTTLVAEMLAAFLKKREWLGFVGVGGRALVIDLEQGQRSIKRMLRTADLQGHDDLDILPVPDGLDLDKDEVQRDQIEELIRDHHYDIVVLDPYYKAHTGDSNDERQTDSLMRIFDRWRTQYGFCLVMPAHCRKPNPAMPGAFTIHDIFGSSAFLRGAEVVVGIRRLKDGYSKLHFFKDRDGELPTGSAWGLLFDSDGYRRDPADGVERDYLAELDAAMEPGTWYSFSELKAPKAKGGIGARKEAIEPVLSSHPEVFEEGDKAAAGRSWNGKYWRKLSPLSPEPGDSFSELKTLGSCHETQVPGSAKPVTVSPSYIGDRFGRDTFAEGHCPDCGAKLLPHIEHFCAAHPLAGGDR